MIREPIRDEFGIIADGLFNQQLWCFGKDIERAEGNWLVESGFKRDPPPPEYKDYSSVYTLELSPQRRLVLRGFGVFLGDDSFGGLFIERSFRPLVSKQSRLVREPWTNDHLPRMRAATASQEDQARVLLRGLIDWFVDYEIETKSRLSDSYRERILDSWDNGKRWSVGSVEMVRLWRRLGFAIRDGEWNPLNVSYTVIDGAAQ